MPSRKDEGIITFSPPKVNTDAALKNFDDYFAGEPLENEICYRCLGSGGAKKGDCPRCANDCCHGVT